MNYKHTTNSSNRKIIYYTELFEYMNAQYKIVAESPKTIKNHTEVFSGVKPKFLVLRWTESGWAFFVDSRVFDIKEPKAGTKKESSGQLMINNMVEAAKNAIMNTRRT